MLQAKRAHEAAWTGMPYKKTANLHSLHSFSTTMQLLEVKSRQTPNYFSAQETPWATFTFRTLTHFNILNVFFTGSWNPPQPITSLRLFALDNSMTNINNEEALREIRCQLTCSSTIAWTAASGTMGLPMIVSCCEPNNRTLFKINCNRNGHGSQKKKKN